MSKSIKSDIKTSRTERSTGDVIRVLNADFDRLSRRMLSSAKRGYLSDADSTHARGLIRALFALVEGTTFAMKVDAVMSADEQGSPRSHAEETLAFEVRHELNERGEIVQRPAKISLERSIRFAFALYANVFGVEPQLDTNASWWHAFKRSTKVRDRLMHPRFPEDTDVYPRDILDAMEPGTVSEKLSCDCSTPAQTVPSRQAEIENGLPNGSLLPTGLFSERDWLTAFACRIVMRPRGRALR